MDYFNLKMHNTNYKSEILSGIATYVVIAYIIVLNPAILCQTGMNYHGIFWGTCISIIITTAIGAVTTKLPLIFIPNISLSCYFVLITSNQFEDSWKLALLATYLSGFLLYILYRYDLYEKISKIIPPKVYTGITAGIGLAIFRMGLHMLFYTHDKGLWKGSPWRIDDFVQVSFQFPSFLEVFDNVTTVLRLTIVGLIITMGNFCNTIGIVHTASDMLKEKDANFNRHVTNRTVLGNSIGCIMGSCIGTASVTIGAESTIGISLGAKTGLSSLIVCVLVLVTMVGAPFLPEMNSVILAFMLIIVGMVLVYKIVKVKSDDIMETITAIGVFLCIGFTNHIPEAVLGGLVLYYLAKKIMNYLCKVK